MENILTVPLTKILNTIKKGKNQEDKEEGDASIIFTM